MEKNIELGLLLAFYGALLTEKQQSMLSQHVDEDFSLREIAEQEGISRQGVHDVLRRAEAQLLDLEEKFGLLRRRSEMQNSIAALQKEMQQAEMPQEQRQAILYGIERLQDIWED